MKNKLDLNNLLAKYEGIAGGSSTYYSPAKEYVEPALEQQFYQNRTYQNNTNIPSRGSSEPIIGNFQMSKSQCEQYLLKIKEELKRESKSMNCYADTVIKQLHENFQRQHEKIKREILELLDRAFQENQKRIRDELNSLGKIDPPQFSVVYRQIQTINQNIDGLLQQLRGSQYRRAIAEVVVKDFMNQINDLKVSINSARDNYISYFGEVEPDREKINCIRNDLHLLFKLSKKNANLVQKVFQDVFKEKEKPVTYIPQQEDSQAPRIRKSFFNFG